MSEYLKNYRYTDRIFIQPPAENLNVVVVIPCHNETGLIKSLQALKSCDLPQNESVEVIVVINAGVYHSEQIKEQNQKTYSKALAWNKENSSNQLRFLVHLNNELPKKHAGVGLARKIGMDEAVDRLYQANNRDGVILCFDADSLCEPNYLVEVSKAFKNSKLTGASIYYEHPTEGTEYDKSIYEGITLYELFLRFYRQAVLYAGHPQSYHTIGSSMAARCTTYEKMVGMNKRKAGEDFYFLQKIIQWGGFGEVNSTKVIPSPRTSDRVPFGTGKAIADFIDGRDLNQGYAWQSFEDVKLFLIAVRNEYNGSKKFDPNFVNHLPASFKAFIEQSDFNERVQDLLKYGTNWATFSKRFYNWFNGLRLLKYMHFARDNFYPNEPLLGLCTELISKIGVKEKPLNTDAAQLLNIYRFIDRGD